MLRSPGFYALWIVYFLGSSIGLTAIGESAPLVRELAGASAAMSGGLALGVMSLFNGAGRLAWGAASDRVGRRPAVLAMFAIGALSCALLLPRTEDFWRVLAGLSVVGFCYGGYLALMPSLVAEHYGARHVGANYGLLFTAWGAAGFTIPRWIAGMIEEQKLSGSVADGYNRMFYTLGALAVLGLLLTLLVRRPGARPSAG
jgi:OFA family oxalate/formate antiporter-like MFS transporter